MGEERLKFGRGVEVRFNIAYYILCVKNNIAQYLCYNHYPSESIGFLILIHFFAAGDIILPRNQWRPRSLSTRFGERKALSNSGKKMLQIPARFHNHLVKA
jgi:hypothetical protein